MRSAGNVRSCALSRVVSVTSASVLKPFHLGERERCFGGAGVGDDGLQFGIQRLPGSELDHAFTGTVGLVETGAVLEWRDPIEPERNVGARTDEFRTINHARLQRPRKFRRATLSAGRRRAGDTLHRRGPANAFPCP